MNIVFDLGNVLLAWRPEELLHRFLPDPALYPVVLDGLIRHPDWIELDRGTLPYPDAIARVAARTGAPPAAIEAILHHVQDALHPIQGTFDILHRLRRAGHPVYVLSNMHPLTADALDRDYPILGQLQGVIFSCRHRLIKPDPAIYRLLLDTWALDPARTLFVDDLQTNVDAARAAGIQGLLFETPARLAEDLEALGCF